MITVLKTDFQESKDKFELSAYPGSELGGGSTTRECAVGG